MMSERMMWTNEKCPNCDGRGAESDGEDREEVECWQCRGWRKITVSVPTSIAPSKLPTESKLAPEDGEKRTIKVQLECEGCTALIETGSLCNKCAGELATYKAQVESGEGLPHHGLMEYFPEELPAYELVAKLTDCDVAFTVLRNELKASLLREKGLVDEVERLKGLLRETIEPGVTCGSDAINLVGRIKAAVTGEQK